MILPRPRDPEATQEAILEAAERLFVDKGPADVALSAVATAAGVTKSLIHHHFGSKEGLWRAVKERRFSAYADLQRQMLLESAGTADLLRRSLQAYFRFLAANPEFVRFMCWMRLEPLEADAADPTLGLFKLGMEKVRQAQEAGELRDDVHPASLLLVFLGAVNHWFEDRHTHCAMGAQVPGAPDDEHFLADLEKVFFEGARPR